MKGETDPAAAALEACIGTISSACTGPREADTSLRMELARIADRLLLTRTGRPLRGNPAAARLLGAELAWFIDPERPVRGHDDGRGLTGAEIDRMLHRLEELGWR